MIVVLIGAIGWYVKKDNDVTSAISGDTAQQPQLNDPPTNAFVENDEPREEVSEFPLRGATSDGDESCSDNSDEQLSQNASVVRILFATPNYGTEEFRVANEQANLFLTNHSGNYSRNMVVKTDVEAIKEFARQVESNSNRVLDGRFDLSPYSDVPCVASSIRGTSPSFIPGVDEVPTRYWVDVRCEPSGINLRISFLQPENIFRVNILSSTWGSFIVRSLGDWEYSLAYRNDDFVPFE